MNSIPCECVYPHESNSVFGKLRTAGHRIATVLARMRNIRTGYDPKGPIFISYRQRDGRPFAEDLDIYLRAGGLVPWRDLIDLPPGETAQRVAEAFDEGISNAVLIVTPGLKDSAFVSEEELPRLLEVDADIGNAKPFHLLVLNTVAKEVALPEGSKEDYMAPNEFAKDHEIPAEIDVEAPDRILHATSRWPPACPNCGGARQWTLRNLKQYAYLPERKEARQLYADLLDARLAARVGHLVEKEVAIQTQTRPEGNARSRLSGTNRSGFVAKDPDDPYDLIVRLRQDPETGVPSEKSMKALKETLPLMVDGLYGHGVEKVRLDGSGHAVLLWAIGAALPMTRMPPGSLVVEDNYRNRWYDALPKRGESGEDKKKAVSVRCRCSPRPEYRRNKESETIDHEYFQAVFDPPLAKLKASEVQQDRVTRAAVLFHFGAVNIKAFDAMTKRVTPDLPPITMKITGRVPSRKWIPSGEGARLATSIMFGLRNLVNDTGIDEIHIAYSLPTAFAALLGRSGNTMNFVLHELGTRRAGGDREYIPVARIEAGMPGGPVVEVFPSVDSFASPNSVETRNATE